MAGRPLDSAAGRGLEESPGSTGTTVPANGRRGRPQGKCHRKQTARFRRVPAMARVAPGKGERVRQERTAPPATGAAWQTPPGARPNRGGRRSRVGTSVPARWTRGRSCPAARVGRERHAARRVPEEWPSHPHYPRGWTEPGLQAAWRPFPHKLSTGLSTESVTHRPKNETEGPPRLGHLTAMFLSLDEFPNRVCKTRPFVTDCVVDAGALALAGGR